MQLDEIIKDLTPLFKDKGYIKSRMTWRKSVGDVTLFFSVQISRYSKDRWYYYFGVTINAMLKGKEARSFSSCQLWDRLDYIEKGHTWTAQELFYLSERWETLYGAVDKLHIKAIEGKLPQFVESEAIRYISAWH